jgi:hypothetical protein
MYKQICKSASFGLKIKGRENKNGITFILKLPKKLNIAVKTK